MSDGLIPTQILQKFGMAQINAVSAFANHDIVRILYNAETNQ